MPILKPAARIKRAEKIRFVATKADKHIATHKENGDEALYPEKWGSYLKGLAHDAKGDVRMRSYNSMLRALGSGAAADFDQIGLGGAVPLVDPQAGLAFTLEGQRSPVLRTSSGSPACFCAACWRSC